MIAFSAATLASEYLRLLVMPPTSRERISSQNRLALLRDALAAELGIDSEEAQNAFELIARMRVDAHDRIS